MSSADLGRTVILGKTVILGSTGFVGRALHRYLAERNVSVSGFSSKDVDLCDRSALAPLADVLDGDTTLVFASALTPDRGQTLDTFASNVAMAVNVARILETRPVRKCVFVSSDGVYGFDQNPVTESTPPDPVGYYALAKFTGERVLQTVGTTKSIPTLILRPVAIYGPGDTHNSYGPNRFSRTIATDKAVRIFGQGEETRDHLYVDDIAYLVAELSASDATGIYNLATGESRTFGSIVDDLRAIVPYEFTVENAPRGGAITHRSFDVSRLRAAIPDLRLTPFSSGLARTFAAAAENAGRS